MRRGQLIWMVLALLTVSGLLTARAQVQVPPGVESAETEPVLPPPPPPMVVVDGVTFAVEKDTLYAPTRAIGKALEWRVRWDAETASVFLNEKKVAAEFERTLQDGTRLIRVRDLDAWGATANWDAEQAMTRVDHEERQVWVLPGEKRVAVNRKTQRMRAWQGDLLVLDTNVSTGRRGHRTPTGSFTAGPLKARMLISRKYGDAKMPWSVQLLGDVVIHGFPSVPAYPASHGCVRVPLTGPNPAKWFYEWVNVGTPVIVQDGWPEAEAEEVAEAEAAG